MSRNVPLDRALSDEDRVYLESRGVYGGLIERLDNEFGTASEPAEEPESEPEVDKYDSMTKEEIQAELTKRELPKSGSKEEVLARLRDDDTRKGA